MQVRADGPARRQGMQRRSFMASAVASWLASGVPMGLLAAQSPRQRVILDNDYSGDPDGLFQLAHHLLSPSVSIPFIIGSHIHVNDFIDGSERQADNAVERVKALLVAMKLANPPEVLAGRNRAPEAGAAPTLTKVTERIIVEARRTETDLPLVYAAGGGLTELAEALRLAPDIGSKIRLVWIGGLEWPDYTSQALVKANAEYNTMIDLAAARTIFNNSDVEIWQVPRNVYRQMMVSMPELRLRLNESGELGRFLLDALNDLRHRWPDHMGETFILGDNPLVALTALLSSFEPDTSSSDYELIARPTIGEDGTYEPGSTRKSIRVYRSIDTRLTFADMFAKFAAHANPGGER